MKPINSNIVGAAQDRRAFKLTEIKKENILPPEPGDSLILEGIQTSHEFIKPVIKEGIDIPENGEPETPETKWTILMYMAGDNDRASQLRKDVIEAEGVGSTPKMNLVTQLDLGAYTSHQKGCKRYHLEKSDDDLRITSPVLEDMGSINMSAPYKLADFIQWGMEKYPADHYMLVIASHGYGWKGAVRDFGSEGWMTPRDLKEGLNIAKKRTGKKIDILGFDAHLMANVELAYELSDSADILVAPEMTHGDEGWHYARILASDSIKKLQGAISEKANIEPEEFARKLVDSAAQEQENHPTMSAINLQAIKNMAKSADNLAQKIIETDDSDRTIRKLFKKAESFYGFKDAYHLAKLLESSKDLKDEDLKKAAKDFMGSIESAVIAEQHSQKYPEAHGMTIHAPHLWTSPGDEYKSLDFAHETMWDEMLKKIDSWFPF